MLETSDNPGELVVRMPSFWQMMKAGAAFTLGAGLVTVSGAFLWVFIITGVIFGALSNLSSAIAPKRTAPAPTISRPAPAPSSEHEQLVQDAMRRQRAIDNQIAAEREARKRLDSSHRATAQ